MLIPPLSLYIHIPWCVRKCPYCDFNSHAVHDNVPEQEYVTALLADLEQDLPKVIGRNIETLFIGGGTPSLFSPDAIYRLLEEIRHRLPVSPTAEITLEANPGTVDSGRFRGFHQAGIDRLSIGIQSFNEDCLNHLGRIHGQYAAYQAIEQAQQAGFVRLNLDMMFGLPGQTVGMALQDLETALHFSPSHLSWYQLTLEPNTAFYQHPPQLPDDDNLYEMQCVGQALLKNKGYVHYEISAFAQPGQYCQHNMNYWQFGDYLGIGAGAHGKLTDVVQGIITRFSKQRHPKIYMETASTAAVIATTTRLSHQDIGLEFMMNTLRLREGFTLDQLTARTGLTIVDLSAPLQQAYQQGWLIQDYHTIRPTEQGWWFLNDVLGLFVTA